MQIVLTVLFVLTVTASTSDVPTAIVEIMQKSTIPILCAKANDKGEVISRITLGTGFFINRKGDFLTAAHVITSLLELRKKDNPCEGVIYATKTEWKTRYQNVDIGLKFFPIQSCAYSVKDDVGVCGLTKNPFLDADVSKFIQPVSLASYTKYSDGSAIAFTGFPLQFIYPITSKGYIASYDPDNHKLLIDKTAWPGASGSPLYTTDGKVIGIIAEQGTDKSAGLAFARPADLVLNLLREHKIAVEK
jgi:Trypsin-like serine proteases, typically periplasmic, contain C-terminal PDZ domain